MWAAGWGAELPWGPRCPRAPWPCRGGAVQHAEHAAQFSVLWPSPARAEAARGTRSRHAGRDLSKPAFSCWHGARQQAKHHGAASNGLGPQCSPNRDRDRLLGESSSRGTGPLWHAQGAVSKQGFHLTSPRAQTHTSVLPRDGRSGFFFFFFEPELPEKHHSENTVQDTEHNLTLHVVGSSSTASCCWLGAAGVVLDTPHTSSQPESTEPTPRQAELQLLPPGMLMSQTSHSTHWRDSPQTSEMTHNLFV